MGALSLYHCNHSPSWLFPRNATSQWSASCYLPLKVCSCWSSIACPHISAVEAILLLPRKLWPCANWLEISCLSVFNYQRAHTSTIYHPTSFHYSSFPPLNTNHVGGNHQNYASQIITLGSGMDSAMCDYYDSAGNGTPVLGSVVEITMTMIHWWTMTIILTPQMKINSLSMWVTLWDELPFYLLTAWLLRQYMALNSDSRK